MEETVIMGRLFGTDGARGVANSELTCELAMSIGKAAAMVLIKEENGKKPTVLIGKDTRLSSDMLEGALTAGLCSVGADVVHLGAIPTPAVAYLVKKHNADAGIMISASHNPFEFNGIKIFNSEGYKLPDALEEEIEAIVLDNAEPYPTPTGAGLGRVLLMPEAVDEYVDHLVSTVDGDLNGLKIAVDCSNGAASATAKKLFDKLGADCVIMNSDPDGVNINEKCGSTHIEILQDFVKANKTDCGVAFDGDADRCLAVDENGELVDGDFLIAICAKHLKEKGALKNNTAVGTVMTNMGFTKFCAENDINFEATAVGDRYVLESMLKNGYCIGGEQSGHVIFLEHGTTGDGQLTAIQLLSIMCSKNKSLSELASVMKRFPQVLVNVTVATAKKSEYSSDTVIKETIEKVENELGGRGRVLVRPSGTEPLIRVMLEGEDIAEITDHANSIAELIKERLG